MKGEGERGGKIKGCG